MNKKIAIYHRPTILRDDPSAKQLEALQAYAKKRKWSFVVYTEKPRRNIKDTNTPVLRKLLRDAKNKQFDLVLFNKFISIAYSMKHLLSTLHTLNSWGVGFIAVADKVSTGSSADMFLQALMDFQKALAGFSISIGMEIARLRNIALGRPSTSREIRSQIIEYYEGKKSIRSIGKATRTARATVFDTVSMYKRGELDRSGSKTAV